MIAPSFIGSLDNNILLEVQKGSLFQKLQMVRSKDYKVPVRTRKSNCSKSFGSSWISVNLEVQKSKKAKGMGGSEDLTCQGGPEGPVQRDSIYSWVRNIKIKHALAHKSREEVHIRVSHITPFSELSLALLTTHAIGL